MNVHDSAVSSARLPPGKRLAVELRRGDRGREGAELVARLRGDRPLHQPHVARADHAHRALAPRLLAQPAQRRQAVGALVERREAPSGAERPAHALHDDLEAALGEQAPVDDAEEAVPAVRGAHEDRRRLVSRRARGDVAVGEQDHAVVHLGGQVAQDLDVAGLRRGQVQRPAEDLAEQAHEPPSCPPAPPETRGPPAPAAYGNSASTSTPASYCAQSVPLPPNSVCFSPSRA